MSLRKVLCSSVRGYYVRRILQCQLHGRESKRRAHIVICIIKITIGALRNDTGTTKAPGQNGGCYFSFPGCCGDSGVPREGVGVFKPPPPEILKISVESSIA